MFGWTGENESDEDGDVENKKSKKFLQTIYGVLNVTEHLKKKKFKLGDAEVSVLSRILENHSSYIYIEYMAHGGE